MLRFMGAPVWTNGVSPHKGSKTFLILLHGFRMSVVSDSPYFGLIRHTQLASPTAAADIPLICPQAPAKNWKPEHTDLLAELYNTVRDEYGIESGIVGGLSDGATSAVRVAWTLGCGLICHSGQMTKDLRPKHIETLGTVPPRGLFCWTLDDPFPTDAHTQRLADLHRGLGCDVSTIEQDSKNPNARLIGRHHWGPEINDRVVEWCLGGSIGSVRVGKPSGLVG